MVCLRKHIDRLDIFDLKSFFDQKFYISDHSHRIAGDIQQLKICLFFHVANHLDYMRMQTISRWIDDDKTKLIEFIFDLWVLGKCFFCGVGQKYHPVFEPIYLGIVPCIGYRFFDDFYTDKGISFTAFQKANTYTSCSTIQI